MGKDRRQQSIAAGSSRCLLAALIALVCLLPCADRAFAQTVEEESPVGSTSQAERLDELANLIQKKQGQRDRLTRQLVGIAEGEMPDERQALKIVKRDLDGLATAFEIVVLGDAHTELLDEEEDATTHWQQDLLDVLKPLVDSLKSLTKRPRQIADLRDGLVRNAAKMDVTRQALASIVSASAASLSPEAEAGLTALTEQWSDSQDLLKQENVVIQSQLERLDADRNLFLSVWPAAREFFIGRGLTLSLAILAAFASWAVMRFLWWFYSTRLLSKGIRRGSSWHRLGAYGYYLLSTLIALFVAIVVLYLREDLLLLALAFLLIAGAVLGFRTYVPRYVKEARLLLNLGPVREGERVVYRGLPWQVMSLNVYSVLRNPSLDGTLRVPLDIVSTMVSRPVKNHLWFPSKKGDHVILPDGLLGQIIHQTPDLVEVRIRGGMSITWPTTEFYAINLVNLSREKTFGVSVNFGLDYSVQASSLTVVPATLNEAIRAALTSAGYQGQLVNLIAELSNAGNSSLDFLVFVTMDSAVAGDYYKLERLILQTCVAVATHERWTIPFPQLTVHGIPDDASGSVPIAD